MPFLKNKQPSQPSTPTKPATSTKGKIDPFAAKYAETDTATGSGYVPPPPGKYEALIVEAQGVREDEPNKKEYVYLELVIVNCEDEELNGKKIRIFYNFTDTDGTKMPGMPYFKAANEMLGGSPPTSWDDMCDTLAEIAKEQIWVNINIITKGKYTNAYLDSVPENQDDKPDMPL